MKKAAIIVVVVLILLALCGGFLLSSKKAPLPSPSPAISVPNFETWNDVQPGKTTFDELLQIKGGPLYLLQTGTTTTLFYPTSVSTRKTQVETANNQILFVKQLIFEDDPHSLRVLTEQFSTQPVILYGPDVYSSIFLYTYLEEGKAFLAREEDDIVYEVWYFPPSSLPEFLNQPFAQGYSTTIEENHP